MHGWIKEQNMMILGTLTLLNDSNNLCFLMLGQSSHSVHSLHLAEHFSNFVGLPLPYLIKSHTKSAISNGYMLNPGLELGFTLYMTLFDIVQHDLR